jgi:two-component system, NarL family, nitrate/nitrite response regulator NarL
VLSFARPRATHQETAIVSVVVADPHPLFLDALGRAVESDPALVLLAAVSGVEALARAVEALEPAVAVIGIELAGTWLGARGAVPTLVLADEVRAPEAHRAIERGGAGYLSRDADAVRICRAIGTVARGGVVLDAAAQTGIAAEIRLRARDDRPVLSPREHEILVLLAEGLTAPLIGQQLHLSTATVKTHLLHIYSKLGVSERAAAVATGMRSGLFE